MSPSPVTRRAPDRRAALAQYRRRAGSYDAELALFEPIRTDAVAALKLRRGESVLDVGCGTGVSLRLLHEGIGASGHIAPPWALPTNAFVMLAALHPVTSFEGLGHPWSKLARRLRNVDVQHALMGGIYIASGVLAH